MPFYKAALGVNHPVKYKLAHRPVYHGVVDHGGVAVSDESETPGVSGDLVGHDDCVEQLAPLRVETPKTLFRRLVGQSADEDLPVLFRFVRHFRRLFFFVDAIERRVILLFERIFIYTRKDDSWYCKSIN